MIQDRQDSIEEIRAALIRRLERETGISEDQAREIIAAIGANYPMLIREARNMQRYR
ncbi:hypothetical protein ACSBOB_07130 [Mesorhizobium sp. ASY16-5R]|uniref:hypothetical protein n=1 Tax=Mesorhizobium sp. ASY16-5R TaxID=3445772 RepID=UPI003FA10B10